MPCSPWLYDIADQRQKGAPTYCSSSAAPFFFFFFFFSLQPHANWRTFSPFFFSRIPPRARPVFQQYGDLEKRCLSAGRPRLPPPPPAGGIRALYAGWRKQFDLEGGGGGGGGGGANAHRQRQPSLILMTFWWP